MQNEINHIIASRLIDEALLADQVRCSDPHRQEMLFQADRAAIMQLAQIEAAQEMGLPIKYDA